MPAPVRTTTRLAAWSQARTASIVVETCATGGNYICRTSGRAPSGARVLAAGRRDPLQRTHVHLALVERARDGDALPDVIVQLEAVRRIDDFNRRRALLQESGLPTAGLRRQGPV